MLMLNLDKNAIGQKCIKRATGSNPGWGMQLPSEHLAHSQDALCIWRQSTAEMNLSPPCAWE